MVYYTSAKGTRYAVQSTFDTGDIVILSDDHAAWKVKREVLSGASPVFAHMLSSASGSDELHLPDITNAHLDILVRVINGRELPCDLSFSNVHWVIDILRRFDCIDAARVLLYAGVRDVSHEHLFDALVIASQLDDLKCACRLVAQGWKWSQAWADQSGEHSDDSDESDSDSCPSALSLRPDQEERMWRIEDVEKVRSAWVWSLTLASKACNERPDTENWGDPKFWRIMVGEFVTNLVQ